jgi:hypothetical protein
MDVYLQSLLLFGSGHGLHCGVVEVGRHLDLEVRVLGSELLEHDVGELGVGAGESADEGDLQVDQLGRLDDAVGDGVALHDAAEDVDQDGLHLRVRTQDLEGSLHLLHVGASAHVQEVGRLAALQLDDVHRGHGEAGSVDHAADVAVQRHVVEAGRDGLVLVRVHVLGGERVLLEVEQLLLSELGVVVDADLGVDGVDLLVGVDRPGVDFELDCVGLGEEVVQVPHLLAEALHVLQLQVLLELGEHRLGDAGVDLEHVELDCVGVGLGHFLDLHAALDGGDDGRPLAVAVEDEGEVDLAHNVNSLVDQHCVHLQALLGGLVGHQVVPQHLHRQVAHFLGSLHDLHSALEAAAEGSCIEDVLPFPLPPACTCALRMKSPPCLMWRFLAT